MSDSFLAREPCDLVLDAIRPLEAAVSLYRKLGFEEIEPYCGNPMDDVIHFGRELYRVGARCS